MGMKARTLLGTGNGLVITDCSNAPSTAIRTAVLAEVANCVPATTPLVDVCYTTV